MMTWGVTRARCITRALYGCQKIDVQQRRDRQNLLHEFYPRLSFSRGVVRCLLVLSIRGCQKHSASDSLAASLEYQKQFENGQSVFRILGDVPTLPPTHGFFGC